MKYKELIGNVGCVNTTAFRGYNSDTLLICSVQFDGTRSTVYKALHREAGWWIRYKVWRFMPYSVVDFNAIDRAEFQCSIIRFEISPYVET